MSTHSFNICIIPARGGSKRIPRKNIRLFNGKPIVAWSVEAALKSGCFDRVIVSTDDKEIAEVSESFGAEIPFCRDACLADDYATTHDVVINAISRLNKEGCHIKNVCCLYATAPFVRPQDISEGLVALEELQGEETYVFPVSRFRYPIQRALFLDSESGRSKMCNPELFTSRSQDLEERYHDAGQFYWAMASTWQHTRDLLNNGSPIVIPSWRVQDIDTIEDWDRAELMHMVSKEWNKRMEGITQY